MNKVSFLVSLLMCAICYNNTVTAQIFSEYNPNSLDFIVGIEYGYRVLRSQSEDPGDKERIALRNKQEKVKPNYRLGFNYNLKLNYKLFLKTGLRYVNAGYKTYTPAYMSEDQSDALREDMFLGNNQTRIKQTYQLLEFPLAVRYIYSENWCKSYIEAGISANHYLQTKLKADSKDKQKVTLDQNLHPWNLSSAIAIGAEFLIRRQIPAFIQMTGRYQLTSLSEEIDERLVGVGIESGIRYEF